MVSRGQMLATCTEVWFVVIMSNIYVLNGSLLCSVLSITYFCAVMPILFLSLSGYAEVLVAACRIFLLWQVNS